MPTYNFTIGKFQPFHMAHERLVRRMMEYGDKNYVGIISLLAGMFSLTSK